MLAHEKECKGLQKNDCHGIGRAIETPDGFHLHDNFPAEGRCPAISHSCRSANWYGRMTADTTGGNASARGKMETGSQFRSKGGFQACNCFVVMSRVIPSSQKPQSVVQPSSYNSFHFGVHYEILLKSHPLCASVPVTVLYPISIYSSE